MSESGFNIEQALELEEARLRERLTKIAAARRTTDAEKIRMDAFTAAFASCRGTGLSQSVRLAATFAWNAMAAAALPPPHCRRRGQDA